MATYIAAAINTSCAGVETYCKQVIHPARMRKDQAGRVRTALKNGYVVGPGYVWEVVKAMAHALGVRGPALINDSSYGGPPYVSFQFKPADKEHFEPIIKATLVIGAMHAANMKEKPPVYQDRSPWEDQALVLYGLRHEDRKKAAEHLKDSFATLPGFKEELAQIRALFDSGEPIIVEVLHTN